MANSFVLAFVPVVIATVALTLSVGSNLWCETIVFRPLVGSDSGVVLENLHFGPFYRKESSLVSVGISGNRYTIEDKCVLNTGTDKDSYWKTTQAFAIITLIIGGVVLFWSVLAPCTNIGRAYWKTFGALFMFCSLTQGLTLLFLQSNACDASNMITQSSSAGFAFYNSECEWDWGTKANISAVVFWFVAGFLMMTVTQPPDQPERPPPETQTVTYTETKNADGTVVVEETNVVKGTYIAGEGNVEKDPEEGAPEE